MVFYGKLRNQIDRCSNRLLNTNKRKKSIISGLMRRRMQGPARKKKERKKSRNYTDFLLQLFTLYSQSLWIWYCWYVEAVLQIRSIINRILHVSRILLTILILFHSGSSILLLSKCIFWPGDRHKISNWISLRFFFICLPRIHGFLSRCNSEYLNDSGLS